VAHDQRWSNLFSKMASHRHKIVLRVPSAGPVWEL
jgi:hypothetical protein